MSLENETLTDTCELRPVIGLTRGLSGADLETLTVDAIRTHRQLVGKADQLFQALPDDYKTGIVVGGAQHLAYIEAMIAMHAQMQAVNTLLGILGYIPKVPVN
ncbi:transcriptional repressor TraM [Pararhizobium sp. YC-54]|uniref:transcriptional repressor TraM n=1 Tax=Pararhizobium sp. YC-54 TaxID=2986920 RepID=UPI0021F78E38|nr:transcriptional repressor TraM [Pararhizobium sp. YC-54]MCW0001884.1 transcriptional repressor TraM [Pararhizobium sp. YC-54]